MSNSINNNPPLQQRTYACGPDESEKRTPAQNESPSMGTRATQHSTGSLHGQVRQKDLDRLQSADLTRATSPANSAEAGEFIREFNTIDVMVEYYTHLEPPKSDPPATGTTNTEGSEAYNRYKEMNPDQVASMMHRDREAFWADMGNMSLEERTDVMQRLQMHLQEVNQMFTMFSQLSQAMHDTARAMINNMRV